MSAESSGGYTITRDTTVSAPVHLFASRDLSEMFVKGAGFALRAGRRSSAIRFQRANLGHAEAYKMHVDRRGISIQYSDPSGAFYAVQTLRQLLPSAIEGPKPSNAKWTVPGVDIFDYPRFQWRGLHLDVSRHFFPAPFIKKYIDYIAMMKGNVFHWHLVDDGGWRIQIDKYPKLTSVGAWRYGITTGWDQSKLRFDPSSGLPKYGGFYTKAEVRDVVKYASERGVTVVPEIEMPGHTMPVLAAYPELGCKNQPKNPQAGQPPTNVYCAGNEASYKFIENVLDEVMALFPSKWIHIGGDEVDKQFWHACPVCQAKIKAEHLKNEEDLQGYFVRRIDKYLASKGRRLIGWDEILEGGLAKGATVMSWRGIDGGIKAAKAGHDVVMSPYSHAYFDASYEGQPTEHVYSFDPVPPSLNAQEAKHVLGGQANIWCERIPTEARVEYQIFPRMAAMAEVLWSPKAGRNLNEFMNRLPMIYDRLNRLGAAYYIPAPGVGTGAYLFKGSASISVPNDKRMPGILRYTTSGAAPNGSSPAYRGPITVSTPTTLRFAYVSADGHPGDIATVNCSPVNLTAEELSPRTDWSIRYYEGSWDTVPNFDSLTPIKETNGPLTLQQRRKEEFFGLDFKTVFHASVEGDYTFNLMSDDGALLKIGGTTIVDNDGTHPKVTRSGKVRLAPGNYPLEVGFFQAGGAMGLSLSVTPPGVSTAVDIDKYLRG